MERKVQTAVNNYLKKIKNLWFYHPSDRWVSGIPDILGSYKGQFFACELKFGNNDASDLQRYVLKKIKKSGGVIGICYSLEEFKEFMEKVFERANSNRA